METVFEAERFVVLGIKHAVQSKFNIKFTEESKSEFRLHYSLWDYVKLVIFGGNDYLKDLEENVKSYDEVMTKVFFFFYGNSLFTHYLFLSNTFHIPKNTRTQL